MPPTTKTPLSEDLRRLVGQPVAAIDTPALVVDLDAMRRNLGRMAEFARKHDIRWRPHAKMHKSSALARLQLHAGAVGVCVQKTSEAEAMAAGGVLDIFISNEVIAPGKLARVADLAHELAAEAGQLAIAVDSAEGVRRLANAMNARRRSGES
ncbi:MAG TPA: alanine racemase, partial [Ramlibacter sp.]|nr:alanine racemase [Ramlibacter sp.]